MNERTLNQKAPNIPGPRVGTTLVFGWTVRQIFTDQYTNGTLTMPNTASAALILSEPGPP